MPNTTHTKSCYYLFYTTTRKRFVIFTCRYFKWNWNTTALSQSNYRNFSCSSINTEISFWFRSLNDAYRKYTGIYISWCLERFLLRAVSMPAFKVAKVAGRRNHWPDQWPSNGAVIFYDAGVLAKLRSCRFVTSLISNMLRELTGQISALYSSFEIKNTHLRLFRQDQGPHTVLFASDMMYKKYKWLIYTSFAGKICNTSKLVEHKTSGVIFFYFSLPFRERNTTDKL